MAWQNLERQPKGDSLLQGRDRKRKDGKDKGEGHILAKGADKETKSREAAMVEAGWGGGGKAGKKKQSSNFITYAPNKNKLGC